jgi:dethiobiotin synthetase
MSVLIVTGTGTDVGKTVTTAALAACAQAQAQARTPGSVAVVKLAQTGVRPGAPGDLAEVTRLSGVTEVHEFARYPDPLSPHHAAQVSGQPELEQGDAVMRVLDLESRHDLVVIEGAGGLLVPFTSSDRWTLVDLASSLRAGVVVVVAAGLGTINHTALTVERLAEDRIELRGIVIGSWPTRPDLATRCNVSDLAAMAPDGALAGVLPAGMATVRDFRKQARAALAPRWGGTFDWPAFQAAVRP